MLTRVRMPALLVVILFVAGCASDNRRIVDHASKAAFETLNQVVPGSGVVIDAVKARVPMATTEQNASAKTFAVNASTAKIYVYRNDENFAAAMKIDIDIDGKTIGKTAGSTFALVEVEPGKHMVTGKAENDATLELVAQAGKNYFVWQEMKFGFISARNKLHLVTDEQGQAGVLECGLIEMAKSN